MNANINKSSLLKTFLQYSIPCILAMLLTSCITVVDGMFIGWKLGIMSYFYIFIMMNITIMMFIRGEGKPQLSLVFSIIANALNIVLDYLFIMRLGYGMKGAALATGISVIVAFVLGMFYFARGKSVFKYCRITFDVEDFKSIIFNGSSEFVGQISISITTFLFNLVIIRNIGVNGVAAYTIVGYISLLQYMVITGIMQGIHPLISYSFGAKDREKIFRILSIGIKAVLLVGAVAFVLSFGATEGIVRAFSHENTELMKIANYGIKIYSIAFFINGFNMVASAYFTSLGDAKTSMLISALRSLIIINILIFLLPVFLGDTGIWLTTPLTEAITFIVSYAFIRKSRARLFFADNCGGNTAKA